MKPLSQIARELGVSNAAVSYVYNGKWRENRINEKLARKIMKKLKEERGAPDTLGQQLRTGKTNTIGVLLTDLERSYNLELLGGIEGALVDSDYLVLLGNSYVGKREEFFIERMAARKVDGLIICPSAFPDNSALIEETAKDIPVVMVDNYLRNSDIPFWVTDTEAGMTDIIEYCLADNRKRIAYNGSLPGKAVLDDRIEAFRKAMSFAGLTVDEELVMVGEDDESFDKLLDLNPDVIVFSSLIYSEFRLEQLKKVGKKIPEDILVIGFDPPPEAVLKEFSGIPFVKQDADMMGKKAVETLLELINGKPVKSKKNFIEPYPGWK